MALEYLLPCKCGQKTRISESLAGTYITCGCGRSVPVPVRRCLYELEPAPVKAVVSAAAAPRDIPVPKAVPVPPAERGLPISPNPAPPIGKDSSCAECGASRQPKANYCWMCGKPMGQTARSIETGYRAPPLATSGDSGCLAAVFAFFAGLAVAAAVVYAMLISMAQECSRLMRGGS